MFRICLLSVTLVLLVQKSESYPGGAAIEACYNFRPGHLDAFDGSAQEDVNKLFAMTAVSSEGGFDVSLKALSVARPFRGFLIKGIPGAYSAKDWMNPKLPMGSWDAHPDANRRHCFRGANNAITHFEDSPKSELTFKWIYPKYRKKGNRNVTFVGTVVENYSQYWTGIASTMLDFSA